MSLSIYTYSNPYEISHEPYWESIRYAAHFCVSQTMVNGLENVYPELRVGQLTTVEFLTKALYPVWDSTQTYIRQYAALTKVLDDAKYKCGSDEEVKIRRSLNFNKSHLLDCIRLLSEMNIIVDNIKVARLSQEQKYLLAAYKKILTDYKELFSVKNFFTEKQVDDAIIHALHDENDKKHISIDAVDKETVVFHGIHQFTPTILNAIEHISKYKRVVMLFNYQEQYKEVYQTWLDVYSCFDLTMKNQINNEFHPNSLLQVSYKGNMLGDALAKLADGEYEGDTKLLNQISVIEFDNITEFSAYVAKIYDDAMIEHENDDKHKGKSVLSYMTEQFYAAENSVNDILKVYFPEQFGERHFLAYPIGHFFVAVTNMWNSDDSGIKIEDLNDVAECLYSEALPEKEPGILLTTFNVVKDYIPRESSMTLESIYDVLGKLRSQRNKIANGSMANAEQLKRLGYYEVSDEDLGELIDALKSLEKITQLFYADFENEENNFRHFYEKIKEFVEQQILPGAEAEDEFKSIIVRLLSRLEEVEQIDINSTFDCLKDTMSYYLKQESQKGQSANWIVRDFQQIDGDILQSAEQAGNVTYHFACVSDTDMNVKREDQFPWPLNTEFFETAYEPLDWKYQVFVKSRKEFKHFKRYALIYGLEFNRCDFKISYVKHTDDKENELYYLLKLLGIDTEENRHPSTQELPIEDSNIRIECEYTPYSETDCYRRKICAYRFALESVVGNGTRYRDRFLQRKYYEVILINNVRRKLAGQMASDSILDGEIEKEASKLSRYFRFVIDSDRMDIITNAKGYIKSIVLNNSTLKQFPVLNAVDEDRMQKRELFLQLKLTDDSDQNVLLGKFNTNENEMRRLLAYEALANESYAKTANLWCQWCPEREICLEAYRSGALG